MADGAAAMRLRDIGSDEEDVDVGEEGTYGSALSEVHAREIHAVAVALATSFAENASIDEEDDAAVDDDDANDEDTEDGTLAALPYKKMLRHASVEELSQVLAEEHALIDEDLDAHRNIEISENVNLTRLKGARTIGDGDEHALNTFEEEVDSSAVEETAFGLPHMNVDDATHRRSSLQVIASAAKEFREMHRASSFNANDPATKSLRAVWRAWWWEVWRTLGYVALLVDAVYVLISVPLRVGFFYDPWYHKSESIEWTRALAIFSGADLLGEVVRIGFIWRCVAKNGMLFSTSSSSSTMSTLRSSVLTTSQSLTKRVSMQALFVRPSRKSLFSTRGSVSLQPDQAVQAAEALSKSTLPSKKQKQASPLLLRCVVLMGLVPIEVVGIFVNLNLLHVTRCSKLLLVGYTLAVSYSALILKCRRFRWAQWLSFSTLATPFYLFWLGLYLCHVSACGYMLLANIQCGLQSQHCSKTPIPGSWVLKDNMERADLWRQYIRTMYWASKTITTLGQGDLVPTTQMETNYCIVVQYVSGLWATSFLASCSFYFSRRDRDIENGVSTRLEQALRFLRSRKVPSTLATQIRNYYQHIQRTRNGIEEDQVLANLPAHYRSQCAFFVKYRLIAKIPFFAKQPKAFLRSAVDSVESDFLSPKQTVLALFEIVELVVVARGDISVLDQDKNPVRTISQEEWFGEEALFEDTRSTFELEAKTFCEVLRLSRPHFQSCMEKHFPRLKIATMIAQQKKRRSAINPTADERLRSKANHLMPLTHREPPRGTIFQSIQQKFIGGNGDAQNEIPWRHPGSSFRNKWRRYKAGFLVFVAIEIPFEIAFEWRVGFFGTHVSAAQQLLYLISILVELFFYVDWYFRVCVFARASNANALKRAESTREATTQRSMREDLAMAAAAVTAQDGLVTKPRELLRLYLASDAIWFDLAINLPLSAVWNSMDQASFSMVVRESLRFTRLLSFGRVIVLKPTLNKIMVQKDFSPSSQLLTSVVVFCIIAANAMACYFFLLADDKVFYDALPEGFDPDVTPVSGSTCLEQATLYGNCTWYIYDRSAFPMKAKYIRSLHWSLVLLSTVGYGDILSFTNSECLIGFWWIYLGALICYFTSCAVGSVVTQVMVLRSAQDARIEEVTRALVHTNVPPAMRLMIRSHYEANWELNGSVRSEQTLMEHLPRSLRHQLSASLYVQDIRRCYVFSGLGGNAVMIREIALLLSSELFLSGITIIEIGHLASALYIIQSGDVELLIPSDTTHRMSSNARRRSVIEVNQRLQNPLYRLYKQFARIVQTRHHDPSNSLNSSPSITVSKPQFHGVPVVALKEGDCFGEEGLLPSNRTALRVTARTLTGTQVATLSREAFMGLAGRFPVQIRQIVTMIMKKQDANTVLYDKIKANFKVRPKVLEFMGMTLSLYCETKVQVNKIITPDRTFAQIWKAVHGMIILYNFYAITFRLAFVPYPSKSTMLALTVVDYFMDAFLYADIYLKWNRFGFEEYGNNVVDLGAIRRNYKKGWFKTDCWSMLPLFYYGDSFAMTVARLPRLLKSAQLLESIQAIESGLRDKFMKGSTTMLSVFDLCKFLIFFLSAAHHIGSAYFLLGRLLTSYGLAASSWMTVDPIINAYPGEILVQYNRAIYWCLETFTVVCFGDVLSRNPPETLFASMTCIIGWMCIGQVVGRITSLMANIDKDTSEHNARIDNLEQFARDHDLPPFLRERAAESTEYKSKCIVEVNLRSTFHDLPPALHAMLFDEMYGSYVRHIPEFRQVMTSAQLRVFADAWSLRLYVTDDLIFEEGRLGLGLYIMKEGRAEYFSVKTQVVFAAIYEGQLFGDVAFFQPSERHMSSVRASRSCQVLQLDRRKWIESWDESSRKQLEAQFATLVRHKQACVAVAHANIAKNFHVVDGDSRSQQRAIEDDNDGLDMGGRPQLQDRSSVNGYSAWMSPVKSLLWGNETSNKIAPIAGSVYAPARKPRQRHKQTAVDDPGKQKLRRCLGISVATTLKSGKSFASLLSTKQLYGGLEPPSDIQQRLELGGGTPNNTDLNPTPSAYVQHLQLIQSRFQRRQERTAFNLNPLASSTPLASDNSSCSFSEIWVEPPPPPSFCLENSKFRRIWNAIMFFICLYYIVVVPFRVSFDYEFLSSQDSIASIRTWFLFEYAMDLLCVVDFVLHKNYFTFVNRGTLVTESHAIRDHYLHDGTYLLDLFCILPFELLLPLAPLQNAPGTLVKVTWYRVAVCRLNKMARIAHLHELGEKLQRTLVNDIQMMATTVRGSVIYFVRFAFDFALGAHWVACMFYGATFNAIDPQNYASWLTTPGMLTFEGRATEEDVGRVSWTVKYARSYHFSMGAITTVSYGDVAPQNAFEVFVTTFVIIISIVLFGMLSGGFNQVYEMELGKRADYEEKIASVAHFMTFHQFPTRIWKHMQSYFMVHWAESQGMNEEELLSGLPLSVKDEITLFVKQDFVKQMKLFAGCDEAFVRAVVASFDQELFVRNDVIITYGDRGRSLYVIESGSVLVRIPQGPVVASTNSSAAANGEGNSRPDTSGTRTSVSTAPDIEVIKGRLDFFGEKSLIFDIPRSATCIALSSCSMLILPVDKYDAIIDQFPEYREKNMRDWIFVHPSSDDKRNRALAAIRRLPTAAAARNSRRDAGI